MKDFSVAICVYNGENEFHFQEAMNSILNQTIIPGEIVLVVDGPVRKALNSVIEMYSRMANVNVYRLENNVGHGEARRVSLKHCKHNIVALMDSDDICVHNRFETQIKVFENKEDISVCGGNIIEFIGDVDNQVSKRTVPMEHHDIVNFMKKRSPFNQMTVMLKKDKVELAGGYLDWFCNEDYFLWLRMYEQGFLFHNVKETLVNVRVGSQMYNRRGGVKYFRSEYRLQKYMLKKNIINFSRFLYNVSIRFVIQVLIPNKLRGFLFRKFAREKG